MTDKDYAKAIARAEAAEKRATIAEAIVCRDAITQAAARAGCTHPAVMVPMLRDSVRMIDGQPRYVETRTGEDGQPVEIYSSISDGIAPHAADPRNAALFGRETYPQTADGSIDRGALSMDQYMTLRDSGPEGKAALGLAPPPEPPPPPAESQN